MGHPFHRLKDATGTFTLPSDLSRLDSFLPCFLRLSVSFNADWLATIVTIWSTLVNSVTHLPTQTVFTDHSPSILV